MEIGRGTKASEAGRIPVEWDVRPLGDVVAFLDGQRRPVKSADRAKMKGSIPYYGASGVVDYVNDYLFDDDLILMGEDGENILSRNLPLVFRVSGKTWVNNHAHVLKPKPGISIGFVTEYLESLNYESLNSGTAQPKLTKRSCAGIPVALPPTLDEQEAIAEALSDADALIESLEKLIAKKRLIKHGAMQELLTGKRRLPGFDGVWRSKTLGDMMTIAHGRSQKEVEHPDGKFPILASGGQIGWAREFLHDQPSVLIGRKGTIDRPQFMETPFWTVDTLFYSRVHEGADAKFLYYRFCLIDWRQYNEASGVPSLNARTIEAIEIEAPPFAEQQAIAQVLTDLDAELVAVEARLAKAKQVKQGMMQQLLTGRIRLV